MVGEERPRSENLEAETRPEETAEQAVDAATVVVENKDAADPVTSSEWAQKAKKFFKEGEGRYATSFLWLAGVGYVIYHLSFFEFAKKLIQKKGKMTMGEGYEISKKAFSLDTQKDKK